ncbi:hypothetical protein WHR41_09215 [Cladosporium halotolerans]|uniref:Poly [ADP-ribose] polymerase n=1 Tax=Cladosporium halotolerans TaxID=1052096 RepID=A0AB34KDB3_9PEZI
MPVTTRRKRPATPTEADAEPAPPRKSRSRAKVNAQPDADQQNDASEEEKKKPAPRKGKSRASAKASTGDDVDGDDSTSAPPVTQAAPKKSRSKVKAEQPDDDQNGDSQPTAKKAAPRKSKTKLKVEPVDDDDAAVAEPEVEEAESKPKIQQAQVAKAGTSQIPLDEGCHLCGYHVYVDPSDGLIFDASLNQTNASGNNNKFYRLQLLENGSEYKTWTRWGRVGESGQHALLGAGGFDDALKNFEKKFRDKSGLKWADRGEKPKPGKYVFVERSYEPDSDEEGEDGNAATKAGASRQEDDDYKPPECTLPPPVKSLMELIFNQQYFEATMASLNYDAKKLPLGKLSKATITRGYQALKDLSDLLEDSSLAASYNLPFGAATEHLSNLYYSTIPHDFGRNRPPIIQTNQQLKREIELLSSLTDLKDADSIMKKGKQAEDVHQLDSRFKGLGLEEMTPLEPKSDEFAGISEYLLQTCGKTHNVKYEVLDVFRIKREGEDDRFMKSEDDKSDRRLLWHGSRATNYGGILGQGLRIAPPEAPVNGYMFDKGIYLADMSSKSANYCCPYDSGRHALLLLCEAELGNPMQVLTGAQYNAGATAKEQGLISTWGQGSTAPKGLKDAGVLHPSLKGVRMPDTTVSPGSTNVPGAYLMYNEFICYDVSQVRLRYLLRVKM